VSEKFREHSQKWNHPPLGSTIKVEPIRSIQGINKIKELIAEKPRDYCLFVLGINTAFRASELLSIRVGQVRYIQPGERLEVKQPKTKKYRSVTINSSAHQAVVALIAEKERMAIKKQNPSMVDDDAFLFTGQRGTAAIQVSTLNNMVKDWCRQARLKGNYGSHTLRKTWGFMQRKRQDTPVPLLMQALGHATQRQTMEYLCIQEKEIEDVYTSLVL
jgi:integrase